jgi:hypothetical protein
VPALFEFLFSSLASKEFLAAIFGALVGGLLAVWAQSRATKAQRQSEQEAERRALEGVLKAIKAELEVYQSENLNAVAKTFAEREEKGKQTGGVRPPLTFAPVKHNLFIVFESNATALGRIEHDELRRKIITTYGQARALVGWVNFSFGRFEFGNRLILEGKVKQQDPELQFIHGELSQIADTIQNGFNKHRTEVSNTIAEIAKYLDCRRGR